MPHLLVSPWFRGASNIHSFRALHSVSPLFTALCLVHPSGYEPKYLKLKVSAPKAQMLEWAVSSRQREQAEREQQRYPSSALMVLWLLLVWLCHQRVLESHFGSHIRVSGAKGRSSSFEVNASLETAVGVASQPTLVHSKLRDGKFPDDNKLTAQIQQWVQTGKLE